MFDRARSIQAPLAISSDQTAIGCVALLIVEGVDPVGYIRGRNPVDLRVRLLISRDLESLKAAKATRTVAAHELHDTILVARISDSRRPENRQGTSRCRCLR